DDTEYRKAAAGYIDASLAVRAIEQKNAERALELARKGELSHFDKAWLLSQAAKLLAKNDHDRALNVLEDAAAEARRIETSDPDRPRAFLAIANVVLTLNHAAIWDTMGEAVKAANS